MNTVQESITTVFPPPSCAEIPEINPPGFPANKADTNFNPSQGDITTEPLPERCQFMFSDGRQCTMARSDIHPSRCRFHAEREEQLFGDPVPGGNVIGQALDLPELYSACRDLSTAAGVNRALAQVFRLLAQRRISRQEAATFGHLAQLLLRSISVMRAESDEARSVVILSGHRERRISPEVLPNDRPSAASPGDPSKPVILSERNERRISPEPPSEEEQRASAPAPPPRPVNSSTPPTTASPELAGQRVAMSNPRRISTSAAPVCNSPEISTYKNTELHPHQNQHLQNLRKGALGSGSV